MQVPTIGRIVHYRFSGPDGSMERPAIIVHVWAPGSEGSAVQLQVFLDANEQGAFNDGYVHPFGSNLVWRTSVMQGNEPGQFHFHEDCK